VTHDREEAFALADRVAILNLGRIEQFASPAEIERAPANDFVREFISDEAEEEPVLSLVTG